MPENFQKKLEQYANEIGEVAAKITGVELVTLMGSVAVGVADELSDFDLLAIYSTEPSREEIHRVLEMTGTKAEKFWMDEDKFTVPFKYKNIQTAVVFMRREWYEKRIQKCPDVGTEDFKQLAFCISEGKYVAGDKGLYDSWKQKIGTMPVKMKDLAINARIAPLRNFFVEKRIMPNYERGDWLFIDRLFASGIEWALEVVYLLNDTMYASPKFARKRIEKMGIKPKDFVDRLERVAMGEHTKESLEYRMGMMAEITLELIALIK